MGCERRSILLHASSDSGVLGSFGVHWLVLVLAVPLLQCLTSAANTGSHFLTSNNNFTLVQSL